jgi:hypothetical protein
MNGRLTQPEKTEAFVIGHLPFFIAEQSRIPDRN